MSYDCILWDLDGTLLDTLGDLAASANAALAAFGYPGHTADEVRRAVGSGVRVLLARLLPDGEETLSFSEIYAYFRTYYRENCAVHTRPYPGIPAAVAALHRQGVAMAVVTNKPDDAAQTLVARFFGAQIPVVVGAGVCRKPCPASCEAALARLHRAKTHAVYIGDSEVDVATAKNAGLPSISVSWGFRSCEILREAGAARIAPDVAALLALLKEEST